MPVKIFANEDLQALENDINDWLIETSEIRMSEDPSTTISYIEGKFIYVINYIVKPKYK
jgi:uncharacterized protein YlzI (FlbEa/FlbD family)